MIQNNPVIYFFLVLVIILILANIYFFIRYCINQSKGKIIKVDNDSQVCDYQNLVNVNTLRIDKNGDYYYSGEDNYYILGLDPVFYLDVCKAICGGAVENNGQCGNSNPLGFEECLNDLQPAANCKNTAKPLAIDDNGIFYYAQSVTNQEPF